MEPKKKPTRERKMKIWPPSKQYHPWIKLSYRISDLPDVRYARNYISPSPSLTYDYFYCLFSINKKVVVEFFWWIYIDKTVLCVFIMWTCSVKSFPARHCSGSAFAACERRTSRVLALKLGPPEDSPWISSSNEIPRPDLLFTSSFSTCTYTHVQLEYSIFQWFH